MNLRNIKIIFSDVDGVLTDGKLLIYNNGIYGKIFNTRDGQGIEMALSKGVKIYWITGRKDYSTEIRASELGVVYIYTNGKNKWEIIQEILQQEGINADEAIYVGDDFPDTVVANHLEFWVPQDAHFTAKERANHIIPINGGDGVLRYVIDKIIQ